MKKQDFIFIQKASDLLLAYFQNADSLAEFSYSFDYEDQGKSGTIKDAAEHFIETFQEVLKTSYEDLDDYDFEDMIENEKNIFDFIKNVFYDIDTKFYFCIVDEDGIETDEIKIALNKQIHVFDIENILIFFAQDFLKTI